jgi:single-strand DNA-binding protein
MINAVVLVGRLTKDLELRYTTSNIAVCKFTLAVNRKFSKDETDFIQCVAWRQSAENMVKFVGKGSLIGIDGYIQTGSYDNKDGVRVYTTEVVANSVQFLEPKKDTFNDQDSKDIYNDIKAGQDKKDITDPDDFF